MTLLYLVLLIIRPQDYPAVAEVGGLQWQPGVLLLAGFLWLFSRNKRFDAPQYPLLVLFYISLMLSSIANGWWGGAVVQLESFGPTLLAFVLLANALDTRERMRTTFAVLCLCAATLALHGILQVREGIGWTGVGLSQGTRIQYVGIFNDPNDLGLLFVTCLPLAWYLSRRSGAGAGARMLWLAVCLALLYAIFLTDSRGTMLALLAMAGFHLWRTRGMASAMLVAVAGLSVLQLLSSRMQQIDASEASAYGRVDSWYEGLWMFREFPLLGVGPNRYTEHHPLTAHNSFVLALAETGAIGYTLWLAFVCYGFWMMLRAVRTGTAEAANEADQAPQTQEAADDAAFLSMLRRDDLARSSALLLSLVGFFTAAFFLSRTYIVILYLLVALVVAQYALAREALPTLPAFRLGDHALRWPLVSVASIAGMYLMVKLLLGMVA